MKKLDMVKKVGGLIVSVGVGAIVTNIVKSTTPTSVGTIKKVCILVGSFVLSGMISDKAVTYTEQTIDNTVVEIKKMVTDGDLETFKDIDGQKIKPEQVKRG